MAKPTGARLIEAPVRSGENARYILSLVCIGALLVDIDASAVVVALPKIKDEFGFSDAGLSWVLNGFFVTYSGFRLLGGRLGDLVGHRSIFLWAILLFITTSVGCAFAQTGLQLVCARIGQGAAGAALITSALSLVINLFDDPATRARAIAVYGVACAGGNIVGLFVGGIITAAVGWRWIFLANVPIGGLVWVLASPVIPNEHVVATGSFFNIRGAAAMTLALVATTTAIVSCGESGWDARETLIASLAAVVFSILFLRIAGNAGNSARSWTILRAGPLLECCIMNALFSAAASATVFASLYMQSVLGNSSLVVGLSFLPLTVFMSAFSLGPVPRMIIRMGIRLPLTSGLTTVAVGLLLLCISAPRAGVPVAVLSALALVGIGAGLSVSPLLFGATRGRSPGEMGTASGLLGSASSIGRVLGIAILGSCAAIRTNYLSGVGFAPKAALNGGYHMAFLVGAICAVMAAWMSVTLLRADR